MFLWSIASIFFNTNPQFNLDVTGNTNVTGNVTVNGNLIGNRISEIIYNVAPTYTAGVGSAPNFSTPPLYTVDFSKGAIHFITPSSTGNVRANFINVPTTMWQTFTLSLIINTSSYAVCANTFSYSSTGSTGVTNYSTPFNQGAGNVFLVANTNASTILSSTTVQQFVFINTGTTPFRVISNVSVFYP